MGNYITRDDMKARTSLDTLINLTDFENTGEINDTALDAAIADAEGIIDGYIGARESTPLGSPPQMIVLLAYDIAMHLLYSRKDISNEKMEKAYSAAIKALAAFAGGETGAILGLDSAADSGIENTGDSADLVMTHDNLSDFCETPDDIND